MIQAFRVFSSFAVVAFGFAIIPRARAQWFKIFNFVGCKIIQNSWRQEIENPAPVSQPRLPNDGKRQITSVSACSLKHTPGHGRY